MGTLTPPETGATPAGELAAAAHAAAIDAAIAGTPAYPDGALFVPADIEGLDRILADAAREYRTVVLVFADGAERVITFKPPKAPSFLASFLRLMRAARAEGRRLRAAT